MDSETLYKEGKAEGIAETAVKLAKSLQSEGYTKDQAWQLLKNLDNGTMSEAKLKQILDNNY